MDFNINIPNQILIVGFISGGLLIFFTFRFVIRKIFKRKKSKKEVDEDVLETALEIARQNAVKFTFGLKTSYKVNVFYLSPKQIDALVRSGWEKSFFEIFVIAPKGWSKKLIK